MQGLVIFDLDNTLVDSEFLRRDRDAQRWSRVRAQLERVTAFPLVLDSLVRLRSLDIQYAIVTHAPKWYADDVVDRLRLSPDALLTYSDLKGRLKPNPYAYHRVIEELGPIQGPILVVGDRRMDLEAASRASLSGGVAGWAVAAELSVHDCVRQGWRVFHSPIEIPNFFPG